MMLQDMTRTEIKEMIAYSFIESGQLKKLEDTDNRVMVNNLKSQFKDKVKRG